MNISEMTIEQLKALAYDQISIMEQTKNNLAAINNKIAEKSKDNAVEKETTKQ